MKAMMIDGRGVIFFRKKLSLFSFPPHTPGPPDLLVESLSNVDLKRSQMTSIGFSEFQHAPFRKGWLFKINQLF